MLIAFGRERFFVFLEEGIANFLLLAWPDKFIGFGRTFVIQVSAEEPPGAHSSFLQVLVGAQQICHVLNQREAHFAQPQPTLLNGVSRRSWDWRRNTSTVDDRKPCLQDLSLGHTGDSVASVEPP